MPITRSMLRKQPVAKPATCSTAETMSDNDHAKSDKEWRMFIERTIGDTLVKVETDIAKLNLLRLFYRDETRPVIPSELYNGAENPQIRLNIKIAVLWLLSGLNSTTLGRNDLPLPGTPLGPLGRYDLPGILDKLWLELLWLLKARTEFDADFLYSKLLPLRCRCDEIAASPGFLTLAPESLYELLREFFIPESTLAHGEMTKPIVRCPLTREEARNHLAKTYSDHYTDYDWSRETPGLLTDILKLGYDSQDF